VGVFIDNKKIVPAPFVNFGKDIVFSDDGRPISSNFRISLNGTLLPNLGSPTSTYFHQGNGEPLPENFITDDEKFNSLLLKQELLREALSTPGFKLTYTPDNSCPIECYPKLKSITFTPGPWVITSEYAIELEAPSVNKVGTTNVEDTFTIDSSGLYLIRASDDWQVKEREDGSSIWEIVRTVSATSNTAYSSGNIIGTEAWRNAKTWVDSRITSFGIHNNNIFNLPSGIGSDYYNFIDDESINRLGGSYTRNLRYIYSSGNYIEQRTISRVEEPIKLGDNSPYVTRITINGRIEGLHINNNPSGKLSNAITYWNSIRPNLGTIVGAYGSGITIQYDEDYANGVLNYAVQFINNSGTTYKHSYDVNFNISDGNYPNITIQGTVEGITPDDFYGPGIKKFERAVSGFTQDIQPNLKSLAFAYGGGTLFGASNYSNSFSNIPINKSIGFNKPNGTVNYSYTYGYLDSGSGNIYTDQYTVELSTQNASQSDHGGLLCTTIINGVITGLGDSTDDPSVRNTNAALGWNTSKSLLYTRCNSYYSYIGSNLTLPTLNSRLVNKTVTVNRINGQISYSATFNNFNGLSNSNIAVLDMQIEEVFPQDIVAIQVIPGRSVGPIIQNIGTKTEQRRNINLSMTLYPKAGIGPGFWGISDRSTIRSIASGYLSSGVSDIGSRGIDWWIAGKSENWDWKNGFYTTSMNVILNSGTEN
jgi:hypothetical protein